MRTRPLPDWLTKIENGVDAFEPLENCHRETMRMLEELEMLVARIDQVGIDTRARQMARAADHYFSEDLRQHHVDEETHVFPALAAGGDADTIQAVARLKQDHAWLRADWWLLSPLVRAIAAGQSWVDLDVLRDGVEVFGALARDHIALEESLIYPQARIRMLEASQREMRREMAARR
jgi:iron-sulfur cluster repair protein YtfE (RIC family)